MAETKVKVCHHGRYTAYCGNCTVDGRWCIELDVESYRVVCHHKAFLSSCTDCSIDNSNCLIIPFDSRVVCHHGNMETACTKCHVDGAYCLVLKNGFQVVCHHLNFTGYCGSCYVDDVNCKIVSFIGTITNIDYHLDQATIKDRKPLVVEEQRIENPTTATVTASISVNKTLTKSWTITDSHGASVTLAMESSFGVPDVASEKISVSTTVHWETSTSKTTTETLEIQRSMNVMVPPHTNVLASATITEAMAEVPFTASIKYPDGRVVTQGLQCTAIGYGELDIKTEPV